MPKIDKIVSLLMSGDMDSAADEFVNRVFNRTKSAPRLMVEGVSSGDSTTIRGMEQDTLAKLYDVLMRDEEQLLGSVKFARYLQKLGFVFNTAPSAPYISSEYVDGLLSTVTDELEFRDDGQDDQYTDMDDLRDFDEEDRQAAWNDRYQAFKNEY